MNQQQGFLAHADGTIAGLKSQQTTIEYRKTICPADQVELLNKDTDRLQREIDRLVIIRKDITSKLSAEELAAYEASRVKPKTELEKRAEIEEMNRRMNENKDRPGI
jgi:hypothetical protein